MYAFGVSGNFNSGLIDWVTQNWLPLFQHHWPTYVTQIVIGLLFMVIYFFVFKFLIERFNFATPGREPDQVETKLYRKEDYKKRQRDEVATASSESGGSQFTLAAASYLEALGGRDNIQSVTNCATRLRVTVNDESLIATDSVFKSAGAHGVVRNGKAIQIIIGLSVPQVREEFERLMNIEIN